MRIIPVLLKRHGGERREDADQDDDVPEQVRMGIHVDRQDSDIADMFAEVSSTFGTSFIFRSL